MFSEKMFFRFRSIKKLLDEFKELEKQEIYFADINEQNDPQEGLIHFYWEGDAVLWKSLFKHYLLSLEQSVSLAYLIKDEMINELEWGIRRSIEDLPTDSYKKIIQEIVERFFKNMIVKDMLSFLNNFNKRIYKDDLSVILKIIHIIALNDIFKIQYQHNLNPFEGPLVEDLSDIEALAEMLNENINEQQAEEYWIHLFKIQSQIYKELNIINAYNLDLDNPTEQKKWFVLSNFTYSYISHLDSLTYPKSYIACFMKNCTDTTIWGHYGDNHQGVCLVFDSHEKNNKFYIRLNGINGAKSTNKEIAYTKGNLDFELKKIEYSTKIPTINFFESLGQIPMPQLNNYWYKDEIEGISKKSELLQKENIDNWRKEYWKIKENSLNIKNPAWERENEYRLSLFDILDSHPTVESRLMNYEFNDLHGIIFGIKTKIEDKIRIMKIIENKCKQIRREEFAFYQAEFSENYEEIKISKFNLMKYDLG